MATSATSVSDPPWPEDLFEPPGSRVPAHVQLPPQAMSGRHRQAEVNLDLIDSARITLNLFDDTMLIAVRDRIVDKVQGRSVWIGHIEGAEGDSEVVLAVKGEAMMGTVKVDGKIYEVRYAGGKTHVIQETDPEMTLEDLQVVPDGDAFDTALQGDDASGIDPPTGAESSGTVVDLMAVYTPKAGTNAGGADGIEAKIVNAVESANQAYIRSGIDMQLNLVHVAEVSYTESGNMSNTLSDLRGGAVDGVHTLRDRYGADQVVMISTDANYCGIAYAMTSGWVGGAFAPYAFAVVHDDSRYACLSNHSFAHELGHGQGNEHNAENGSNGGAFGYSYGYRLCASGGFRTVMS